MQSQPSDLIDSPALHHSKSVHFPEGLPAFEEVKDFLLLAKEEEAPFMWLQALNVPNLAFIVADPFVLHPSYRPDLLEEDCSQLKIEKPEEAFLLVIINLHTQEEEGTTANMVGPIVINWKEQTGKQVILRNHLDYSVRHRIDSAGE